MEQCVKHFEKLKILVTVLSEMRSKDRARKRDERKTKTYSDYSWTELIRDGSLNKLIVKEIIDAQFPAFGLRLQLSDPISSFPAEQAKSPAEQAKSPAEQAKSPAELGLKNFVICKVCHKLFHKRKTSHDPRNCQIDKKSATNRREIKKIGSQSPFSLTVTRSDLFLCISSVHDM